MPSSDREGTRPPLAGRAKPDLLTPPRPLARTLAEREAGASRSTGTRPPLGSGRSRELFGVSMTALCGGALAFNLLLILAILTLIGWQGGRFFWQ